jgi:hypothetical protein
MLSASAVSSMLNGKKMQLHELRLFWLLLGKSFQGFIEREDLVRGDHTDQALVLHLDPVMLPAMLDALLATRLLHEDASHGLGRGSEEMAAMCPSLLLFHIHQANIRFVDERRGLQGMTRRFVRQHVGCQAPQVPVNYGQQLLGSMRLTAPNGVKDMRDLTHEVEAITSGASMQRMCIPCRRGDCAYRGHDTGMT